MADTPQQAWILRQRGPASSPARKARKRFPAGTRVVASPGSGAAPRPGAMHGTVERHVPALNSQGGHLTVRWDNGVVGRVSCGSVVREDAV